MHVIDSKPTVDISQSSSAQLSAKVSESKQPSIESILDPSAAPSHYKAGQGPSEAQVQQFLDAFAQNNHVYSVINNLNNTLKGLFREMRETEASARIKQYIHQFDLALEKRDDILKAAEEVKELRMEAADKKKAMGIAQSAIGIAGAIGAASGAGGESAEAAGENIMGGAFKVVESKIDALNIQADDVKARLEAIQTEWDAKINLAKQQGELAGAQIGLLDSLNNTFSQLINQLHANHSGTVNAMSKGMV